MMMQTNRPTDMDVLLGRGVGISRHPGNQHFRLVVSEYVDAYMISTKKQKMNISRSIVDRIHNEFNARFLEKRIGTDLWVEVEDRRALEKTAQALRDGALPLKKKLVQDMSDSLFENDSSEKPLLRRSANFTIPKSDKKHRRTATAPTFSNEDLDLPSFSDINFATITQQQIQLHQGNKFANSPTQPETVASSMGLNYDPLPCTSAGGQKTMFELMWDSTSSLNATNPLPLETRSEPMRISMTTEDMMSHASAASYPVYCHNSLNNSLTVPANEKNTSDADEFAKEMGPDEHFFGLCSSDPIDDIDGDVLFGPTFSEHEES
mmetsp:Transcript_40225/g.84482  ORF Transcript_40225/g.84482 Transcript_40225/m.84482 type:complete len:321 (-) Transcript_40225:191-1153(-)